MTQRLFSGLFFAILGIIGVLMLVFSFVGLIFVLDFITQGKGVEALSSTKDILLSGFDWEGFKTVSITMFIVGFLANPFDN